MNSIFEIFKIGLGPSSSHTVGPMKASKIFRDYLIETDNVDKIKSINIILYGSLAFTGKGHNIDTGLILGLFGYDPEKISNSLMKKVIKHTSDTKKIDISNSKRIKFDSERDIIYDLSKKSVNSTNKMKFIAYDSNQTILTSKVYLSIGGGFIRESKREAQDQTLNAPYSFSTCEELLELCDKNNFSIDQLTLENEKSIHSEKVIKNKVLKIWNVMNKSINKGLKTKGIISGGLQLERRAPHIYEKLIETKKKDSLMIMDWVNLYAMAVNEENASGGKIVTAPTNGAAGIIPAVIRYYLEFTKKSDNEGLIRFFLTAGSIAVLYKKNASISGAEVGCQGEVGVACSMAAGGLVSALGGTNKQIENAAEIAMEHNLGLTCDPVKGLVQIPCIERNAMGAIKAINASRISMLGKGEHKVSLDEVIKTMMETGKDMQNIYKETSQGGLAVNVTEC